LVDNNTFKLVELPAGHRPIHAKWVYKLKYKADGSVDRYKARWVAKGYSQQYGVDYDETFAPVMRLENLRFLLALANAHDLEIHQMDVESAFLHAPLMEEVYVVQPEGYKSADHPNHVYRLLKSLYGLKQAPYEWNHAIDGHLQENGYIPLEADKCVYVKYAKDNQVVFIGLYVDDCTILAHQQLLVETKAILSNKFKIKDLGEVQSVLGLEIIRDRHAGTLDIHQVGRIDAILSEFNMQDCNKAHTPMITGLQLPKVVDFDPSQQACQPYREAVGKLLYLAQAA
jgi:hypothetical protein